MASTNYDYNFPYFPPHNPHSPPKIPPSHNSPTPPNKPIVTPPPPNFPAPAPAQPPRHSLSPPTPAAKPPKHSTPPLPPIVKPPPPSHSTYPPPPSHPKYPPPPPFHPIHPPPPIAPIPSPPGHHSHTVIVVIFVSLGGIFFLAFLSVALCCFLKKKKRTVQETDVVKIDEHLKIKEAIIPGPHGPQTVILSVDDDIHIQEEIRKNETSVGKGGSHITSEQQPEILDLKPSTSGGSPHQHIDQKTTA